MKDIKELESIDLERVVVADYSRPKTLYAIVTYLNLEDPANYNRSEEFNLDKDYIYPYYLYADFRSADTEFNMLKNKYFPDVLEELHLIQIEKDDNNVMDSKYNIKEIIKSCVRYED